METEAKKKEEELAKIAPRLAHDILNPLGAIEGFASLLKEKERDPKLTALYAGMLDGCKVIQRTLLTFTEFAKPLNPEFKEVNLNQLIEEIKESMEIEGLKLQLPESPLIREADPKLIKRALIELVKNALEASKEGEEITLGATLSPATLFVRDRGSNSKEADYDKLFTLFYSSKERGRGVGLSLVQKIALLHGAEASLLITPSGTTATIEFR